MSDENFHREDFYCEASDIEESQQEISYKSVQGEKRLLKAVLEKAVDDITDPDDKVRAEVEEWFSAEYDESGGIIDDPAKFTLQYICDSLDLDFETVQQYAFKLITKR